MYDSITNSKIGYDCHKIDNLYDIVEVNYDGISGCEISNIYTLKVLRKVIELYKTLLLDVESDLLSVNGKVVLNINRDFNSIESEFVNIPDNLKRKIKKLLNKNCTFCN